MLVVDIIVVSSTVAAAVVDSMAVAEVSLAAVPAVVPGVGYFTAKPGWLPPNGRVSLGTTASLKPSPGGIVEATHVRPAV